MSRTTFQLPRTLELNRVPLVRASETIISLVSVYLMNTTSVYPVQVGSDRVFSFGYVEGPAGFAIANSAGLV